MTEFRQEMPPPGGYAPITYQRIPLKEGFFTPKIKFACLIVMTGLGLVGYYHGRDKEIRERIEMSCARMAVRPMIEAEADRTLLKQLRRNRDLEEKIMKNVEGWEVGKYKHAPVYLTLGPDDYFRPHAYEYYAHGPKDPLKYIRTMLRES